MRRRRSGFTLIEVLVALAIVAMAVTMMSGMIAGSLSQTAATRDARASWELAALAMGQILVEEAPKWKGGGGEGSHEWPIPESAAATARRGFRVQYEVKTEELMLSNRDDAVPEKILKVVVRVLPPAGDGADWETVPVELTTYHPYEGAP